MKRRSTKHKQAILKAFESNHLLSARELGKMISDADESTIYRNLTRLEEGGVLQSVQVGNVTKYELCDTHAGHNHFICNDCEMVKTIFLDEAAIKSEIPTETDFSVIVRGVCHRCR